MTPVKTFSLLIGLLIIIVVASSVYTVQQGEQGILLRLGKIQETSKGKPVVKQPGLHFKLPLVDRILRFDTRLQADTAQSSRIYIKKDTYFVVDYYAKWRIVDLSQYYTATGGQRSRVEKLMEQKINNSLRADFSSRALTDIVAQDKGDIMKTLRNQVGKSVENLGIKIIDLRLTAIELPEAVKKALFASMIARWEAVANRHRANGARRAAKIKAEADAESIQVLAQADRQAKIERATGKARAADIYAKAYSKDPKFYSFYRSLTAYADIFNNNQNVLVLKPDGQFFKYFNSFSGSNDGKQ